MREMGYEDVAVMRERGMKKQSYGREGYEKVEIMSERRMKK